VGVFVQIDSRKRRQFGRFFAEIGERVYTLIVTRGLFLAFLFLSPHLVDTVAAQQPPAAPQEPPEEDASLAPKEYALNPVQSAKEIVAGNFYMKKGNSRAAMQRYTEATRWDPGSAEAFLKLGEASEKAKDYTSAREAFTKYVELVKDPKEAEAMRKRIEKLPAAPAAENNRKQANPTQPLDKVPDPDPVPSRAPRTNQPARRR